MTLQNNELSQITVQWAPHYDLHQIRTIHDDLTLFCAECAKADISFFFFFFFAWTTIVAEYWVAGQCIELKEIKDCDVTLVSYLNSAVSFSQKCNIN